MHETSPLIYHDASLLRYRIRKGADRRREEVLAAARGDERGDGQVVIGIEDIDARCRASSTIPSLADDRVEAGRRVILAEDEVGIVGPSLLLEGEAVGDNALVGDESETTLS